MEALAPLIELRQEVSVKASQRSEDLELTRRSQAGDTEAFGELVSKYSTKIFTMVYCILGDENDAWDLAQEGFLKAWRSIQRFEARSSFYTWLYSITMSLTMRCLHFFPVHASTVNVLRFGSWSTRPLPNFLQSIALWSC